MDNYRILVINPGSTSTKIGLFSNEEALWERSVRHSHQELLEFSNIMDQKELRTKAVLQALTDEGCHVSSLQAVCGRGGLLHPLSGGTYEVNGVMLQQLEKAEFGVHACNLGAIIAEQIARPYGIPAYIVDPVVVDEMMEIAKVTGLPQIERKSIFHALNQKSVLRWFAKTKGKAVEDISAIVVHLGGGISIGAHLNGKVVDVNNALNGEGAFSPERAGSLPNRQLLDLVQELENPRDIDAMLAGKGGLTAHFGTNNLQEVEKRMQAGDARAKLILEAMVYQIAKGIAEMSVVFKGSLEGVILTGGMAHSEWLTGEIEKYVHWIAPIYSFPGEDECLALAQGAYRVLTGQEVVKQYE